MPERVGAPENRYYRIETVREFLMRFSRELWDFLRDTNLVARRCAQIALGRPSDIAAIAHDSMLLPVDGQRWRPWPKAVFTWSQMLRPRFNLSARLPDEPATPASRRRFAAPRSEKPPPWGGGLRCRWMILGHRARTKDRFACEKDTDRFSICYGDYVGVRRK